ncbi:disease resistance protein RGA2-like [Triticum dicoccoides]|uniref:disease resistance protein RGA2-like n=1 Tax=Triticum dicoccoides TaxID=85692 RepID=UPI00188E5262|nr:disease resistance protein RGA2-like [Triticum dicoccoides]
METFISAVLGDLAGRAISFVVDKCREQGTEEDDLQRLHQLLLRLRVIIEEAEGRCVTNRGMICQVSMMRKQMFRGHYLLDTFKCREKKTDDEEVSRSLFIQSKFNPAKRFRRLSSGTQIESIEIGRDISKELKQLVLALETVVVDMKEFAIFLMSYPRMCREPYGAYLFFDKCMFGRQMEREQAISFLLQPEPLGGENLGVLPIVGPGLIGKSTLVEHVCDDERVHNHFSLILLYNGNDLKDETAMTFRDHCVVKHQNMASGKERLLVVIELLGDVDEEAWKRLLHSAESCMTSGSKIIVTSRSEKMIRFGTAEAVKLSCLSEEAYWYFFKMLVFGSTDPEEHPRLTSIAMELALRMCGSFISACVIAALLRENLSAWFWCRVLRSFRKYMQKNLLLFGEYRDVDKSRYIMTIAETQRVSKDLKLFLLYPSYQKGPAAQGEVPRITVVDVLFSRWSTVPQGKFEVLCWRSVIPPYYNYIYVCEFVQHKNTTP